MDALTDGTVGSSSQKWRLPGHRPRASLAVVSGVTIKTLILVDTLPPITPGMLDSARFAMPAVVYSLLMFASGSFMILAFGRQRR